jgi:hypothetical protein
MASSWLRSSVRRDRKPRSCISWDRATSWSRGD